MPTIETALPRARVLRSGTLGRNLGLLLLLLLLLFLTVYPLAMLVYVSLHTTPPGAVVCHRMQSSTPFLFLLIVGAFKSMDPAREESSRMSGASGWTTFRRVTLGLMLPVTTSAFILSFVRGVESFESALIFGTPAGIEVRTAAVSPLLHH